ncbi:hypothetical protein [Paraflavitalea speifideaquila]|uniref:hypothetical protein n=1 Tax=Paraflavitalea speifideaquila TaxID=3076558 RepID=UPI0028E7C460|nr:hypothetical protein [Paraflavitalea speifideiaquila]
MKSIQPTLLVIVTLCTLLSAFFFSCATDPATKQPTSGIPYPQPLPDSTALTFLPNLVSKDSFDFNAAFSPDGKSYYFTRNINHKTIIHVSHYNDTNWTEPVPISLGANGYSDADPVFAPDGKFYFISDRPKNVSDTLFDFDIWVATPLANNNWSAPNAWRPSIPTATNSIFLLPPMATCISHPPGQVALVKKMFM